MGTKRVALLYVKTAPFLDEKKVRGKKWKKYGNMLTCEVTGENWTKLTDNLWMALRLLPFENPATLTIEVRGATCMRSNKRFRCYQEDGSWFWVHEGPGVLETARILDMGGPFKDKLEARKSMNTARREKNKQKKEPKPGFTERVMSRIMTGGDSCLQDHNIPE